MLSDLNSGTYQNSVWSYRWISLIFGCKYFNRRRLADSPVEFADGTSYFVTQIKQPAENLNIYNSLFTCCLVQHQEYTVIGYSKEHFVIETLVNNFQEVGEKKKSIYNLIEILNTCTNS